MWTENTGPLAFINDGLLQHMRVGDGAGIGAKYLAREDSHVGDQGLQFSSVARIVYQNARQQYAGTTRPWPNG